MRGAPRRGGWHQGALRSFKAASTTAHLVWFLARLLPSPEAMAEADEQPAH
jgi:hypothetical protein